MLKNVTFSRPVVSASCTLVRSSPLRIWLVRGVFITMARKQAGTSGSSFSMGTSFVRSSYPLGKWQMRSRRVKIFSWASCFDRTSPTPLSIVTGSESFAMVAPPGIKIWNTLTKTNNRQFVRSFPSKNEKTPSKHCSEGDIFREIRPACSASESCCSSSGQRCSCAGDPC